MMRSLVIALVVVATFSGSPAPMFELPAPTGKIPIGTTSWSVSDSRPETFGAPGATREVIVRVWYPAGPSPANTATAPYLREGLPEAQVFGGMMKQPSGFDGLVEVRTHAVMDAPIAASPARFPVLLFSSGYTGIPSSYTALIEDLASHGFIVLHVLHPYEETAVLLSGGRAVTMMKEGGGFLQGIQNVFDEWNVEGDTVTKVTAAATPAEQEKILRGYLGGITQTHAALRRWVDDTKLALDRLPPQTATTTGGRLRARMDLDRIGALGHSMGGVTAGQFCVDDRRCKAGLNLDGIPQYGTMIDKGMLAPFLMVYSGRAGRLGASDVIYRKASKYYRVDAADTMHLDFSDMILWGGPLAGRPIFGKIPPAGAVEVTRTIVREYFDQELLGQPSPLLGGKTTLPGVTVR